MVTLVTIEIFAINPNCHYCCIFNRSILSSMMGSSRASLDSVTDEISEPSHRHTYGSFQGKAFM